MYDFEINFVLCITEELILIFSILKLLTILESDTFLLLHLER